MKNAEKTPKNKRRRRWYIIASILLLYFIGVHVILPIYLKNRINKELNSLEDYSGHVEDVDVWLILGAYDIEDITIYSNEYGDEDPFFTAEQITISLHWKALFEGKIVSEIEFFDPHMHFAIASVTEKKTEENQDLEFPDQPMKESTDTTSTANKDVKSTYDDFKLTVFSDLLLNNIPLKLNRIEVYDGDLFYKDFSADPDVKVALEDINLVVTNLTNSKTLSESMIAEVNMSSTLQNSGNLYAYGKFDPYDEDVTCDLNLEVTTLPLTNFNDLFNAYGKFDVEEGSYEMYTEISVVSGALTGYIKPFINDLKVVDIKEDNDKFGQLVWESIIGGVSHLIKNWPRHQIATKIELEGDINDPDFALWNSIGNLFLHALTHHIQPKLDHNVQLYSQTLETE